MNITVNSQRLAAELRLLNKVVPTKPAIAILSHALLTANADGLHLYATDIEIGLGMACQATVHAPGRSALPVARLLQLVEQFPDGDVGIANDGHYVVVKCGAFKSRLQAMAVEDFPPPSEASGETHVLDGEALRRLLDRTRYAINATSSKYILQGALLTLSGGVAAMVSTDSKRLALATAARTGSDARVIIPLKAMDALCSQMDSGDVEMTVGERNLFFAAGGRLLTSRMIDGEFPKYERIIPQDNGKVVTVHRAALMAALKRVGVVSEENRATYFAITPKQLELSARSVEVGSAAEGVVVDYDGDPLKVCVNGSYVLDFLNAAAGNYVQLHLKDAKSAMLMTDGDDHVGVVMLMKG